MSEQPETYFVEKNFVQKKSPLSDSMKAALAVSVVTTGAVLIGETASAGDLATLLASADTFIDGALTDLEKWVIDTISLILPTAVIVTVAYNAPGVVKRMVSSIF
jgi:hypothetical protein